MMTIFSMLTYVVLASSSQFGSGQFNTQMFGGAGTESAPVVDSPTVTISRANMRANFR